MFFFSFLISRDIISRQSKHNWNYPCTNLLLSRPGLRGRASISIVPQADAATGLTTGMADQAPLMKEDWRRKKESSCSLHNREEIQMQSDFSPLTLLSLLELTPLPEERTLKKKKLLLWLTYCITQKDSRFLQLIQIHKQLFVLCSHIDYQKKHRSHISINQGPILHYFYMVLQVLCCFKGEFAWSQRKYVKSRVI